MDKNYNFSELKKFENFFNAYLQNYFLEILAIRKDKIRKNIYLLICYVFIILFSFIVFFVGIFEELNIVFNLIYFLTIFFWIIFILINLIPEFEKIKKIIFGKILDFIDKELSLSNDNDFFGISDNDKNEFFLEKFYDFYHNYKIWLKIKYNISISHGKINFFWANFFSYNIYHEVYNKQKFLLKVVLEKNISDDLRQKLKKNYSENVIIFDNYFYLKKPAKMIDSFVSDEKLSINNLLIFKKEKDIYNMFFNFYLEMLNIYKDFKEIEENIFDENFQKVEKNYTFNYKSVLDLF